MKLKQVMAIFFFQSLHSFLLNLLEDHLERTNIKDHFQSYLKVAIGNDLISCAILYFWSRKNMPINWKKWSRIENHNYRGVTSVWRK